MTAALTPSLALAYLHELSADIRAAIVLDAAGNRLAGPDPLAAPARALLAEGSLVSALSGKGGAFGARDDHHGVVAVTGPLALPRVVLHDLTSVLAALAPAPGESDGAHGGETDGARGGESDDVEVAGDVAGAGAGDVSGAGSVSGASDAANAGEGDVAGARDASASAPTTLPGADPPTTTDERDVPAPASAADLSHAPARLLDGVPKPVSTPSAHAAAEALLNAL